jgi:hypothetical protein
MTSTSPEPHVSSLDEAPLTGYRKVSLAAVLALIAGLVSTLALAHPFLWIVPPIAVVLAIVALRTIAAEDADVTGKNLAVIGLMFALVFGLWAPARVLTRQWHLYSQAHFFADEWFDLLRAGKLHEAHQLTLPPIERQLPGANLAKVYRDSVEVGRGYKNFFEAKPAKLLAQWASQAEYRYAGGDFVGPVDARVEQIALLYRVRQEADGRAREANLRIVLDRQKGENGRFFWRVRGVEDPDAPVK